MFFLSKGIITAFSLISVKFQIRVTFNKRHNFRYIHSETNISSFLDNRFTFQCVAYNRNLWEVETKSIQIKYKNDETMRMLLILHFFIYWKWGWSYHFNFEKEPDKIMKLNLINLFCPEGCILDGIRCWQKVNQKIWPRNLFLVFENREPH